MQRSGTQEREYQLQLWDATLVERQQSLERVMARFHATMSEKVAEVERVRKTLMERAAALQVRETDVAAREKAVSDAEASLMKALSAMQAQQAAMEEQARAAQTVVEEELIDIGLDDASSGGSSGGSSPSADRSARRAAPTTDAPTPPRVPPIALMSLATRRDVPVASEMTYVTPRQENDPVAHSRSPQLYEGPVDPALPSMVEEITDEPTPHKPRGLRSSPQFHPMDPNDSGLGFLRPAAAHPNTDNDDEHETLDEEEEDNELFSEDDYDDERHAALQDELDAAIQFLVAEGVVSEEDLESWLQNGASAQEIIELFHQHQQEGGGGDGGRGTRYGHDDDFEYADDDEDLVYDEEEEEGLEGGEQQRSDASSAGEPITVDAQQEVLEVGEDSAGLVGDGGDHNDSLASNRVRGVNNQPAVVTATTLSPSSRRHAFDSFDDDSDDNES